MVFLIIIFFIILSVFLLYNIDDSNYSEINNKTEIVNDILPNKIDEYNYDNKPAFRGLFKNTHKLYKSEMGGSKPFKKIIIDNSNMINNKIDYKSYGSYRIKPFSFIQIK
jgi:hypothetical protein